MQKAMATWGPDGSGRWSNDSISLGHLLLHNTPESLFETQPLQHPNNEIVLTMSARLDNRDDLFRDFLIPASEQQSIPDGELILKSYQKWGTGCAPHLLGDWSFALWDAKQQLLFLARDHFGVSSIYYFQINKSFVFASSLKGLLAHPLSPKRLNKRVITSYAPGFIHDAATVYEGIFRLPPAQTITVTPKNTQINQYWQPEDIPEVRFGSDQEYLEAFLDIYNNAIRCCLRSHRPVGAQISGGLDSGSIAILAAKQLAINSKQLPAFSSIPLHDVSNISFENRLGDETPNIEAIVQASGNIDVTFINAQNANLLTSIKKTLDLREQPEFGAGGADWSLDLLETAQQQGIGTLLHGWGGNLTISWTGERGVYLRQLLINQQWGRYIQELVAWQQINSLPFWRVITNQVLKPFIPPAWFNYVLARSKEQWTPLNMPLVKSLASDYRREVMSPSSAMGMLNLFFRNDGRIGFTQAEMGGAFGMEIRQPTMDKRLIDFCLGLPQEQYTRNGQNRLLIKHAMSGQMPDQVLWSKSRGQQNADIGLRVQNNYAEIQKSLLQLESSPLAKEFLNLSLMADILKKTQHDLTPTLSAKTSSVLLQGILLGIFLQRFDDG